MAWVAVQKQGQEMIFSNKPRRCGSSTDKYWNNKVDHWEGSNILYTDRIFLPKGSIKKLTGRDLTWEDEPVELKED